MRTTSILTMKKGLRVLVLAAAALSTALSAPFGGSPGPVLLGAPAAFQWQLPAQAPVAVPPPVDLHGMTFKNMCSMIRGAFSALRPFVPVLPEEIRAQLLPLCNSFYVLITNAHLQEDLAAETFDEGPWQDVLGVLVNDQRCNAYIVDIIRIFIGLCVLEWVPELLQGIDVAAHVEALNGKLSMTDWSGFELGDCSSVQALLDKRTLRPVAGGA